MGRPDHEEVTAQPDEEAAPSPRIPPDLDYWERIRTKAAQDAEKYTSKQKYALCIEQHPEAIAVERVPADYDRVRQTQ